jgi:hypothetical protein
MKTIVKGGSTRLLLALFTLALVAAAIAPIASASAR